MPEVAFPYQKIMPLVRRAEVKRREVFDARAALRQAKKNLERLERGIERRKAKELNRHLNEGLINGSNSQERGIQIDAVEAHIAADLDDRVTMAEDEIEEAEQALDKATCELEVVEDEISLTRAWLYSQTRIR